MKFARLSLILLLTVAGGIGAGGFSAARAAESNAVTQVGEPATNDSLRTFLQLQEQIHATQQSLERNREETERLASKNAEQMDAMKRIESVLSEQRSALGEQRSRELTAMENTNKLLLIVAGSFAGVGFIAMLLTAYLQWRAVNRLAELTALLPNMGRGALTARAEPLLTTGAVEQSSTRLFGALSTLEKRILELEHATHTPLAAPASLPTNGHGHAAGEVNGGPENQVALMLAKGESLLNLDKPEEALAVYDGILAEHPEHPEALVKKGVALEQLRKTDDALRCYDRAIAADGSLTVAYLQKGGLFNRLERYEEALQCYEQALRTQEKAREA